MPEASCPACGTTLESAGADCPRCLLHLALDTSSGGDEPRPPRVEAAARGRLEAGARVGPYVIVREISEGGMGVVYLAEQTEPIRRQVALKVIKHGMDTEQVIRRFEAERQALALMDHAAIARVHGAGETESGRPYFVMEFIDGLPITEYCDRRRLDTAERLALFAEVCDGLQHAHRRGIIHRDVKPSNILVGESDGVARPKIIDFGVAKATEQSLTEHSALTALGTLLGTPEYMSPEQAELAPLHVDTRTDVYSLGVVLYELLTGALPFEPVASRPGAFDEMRRRIREVRPSRPSTRIRELGERGALTARDRDTDAASLGRRLAGDLDLITLKALEKEPDRRYGSPAELADDIRRHLRDQPILARPPSTAYQLRKLISRHRLPAALVIGLGVALVTFSVSISLLYRSSQAHLARAIEAESEAAQVSDFLVGVFEVSDPTEARGNSATARELLDRAAGSIEQELADQPAVQATLMHTMGRVYRSLGLLEPARDLLTRAVARREELLGPDDALVAESLTELGQALLALARYDEAEAEALRAQAIAERQPDPATALLGPLNVLQLIYWQLRDYDRSLPIAERLVEMTERAYGPATEQLAEATRSLAVVNMAMDRTAEAEALYDRVLAIQERVYDGEHPEIVETKLNLAELYRHQARWDEAERILLEIEQIESRIYEPNHPQRAFAFNNLGLVYNRTGRHDEAIEQYKQALAIREASLPENHPLLAWTLDNLGLAYLDADRLDEAAASIGRALEIAMASVGPDNADTGIVLANLALVRREQGELGEAERLYRRVLEIDLQAFGREHGETANTLHNLGKVLHLQGRLDEAAELIGESIEINTRIHGAEHPDVGDSEAELAYVLRDQGKLEQAEATLREGLRVMEASLGSEHDDVVQMKRQLEQLLQARNASPTQ